MNQQEIGKKILQLSRQYVDDEKTFLEKTAKTLSERSIKQDRETAARLMVFAHRRVQYKEVFEAAASYFEQKDPYSEL